jgi:hypothetical protein
MPWSPLLYEKEILSDLLQHSIGDIIRVEQLHKIMMIRTRMISSKSIGSSIRAFEILGYLKSEMDGTFKIMPMRIEARLKELEGSG